MLLRTFSTIILAHSLSLLLSFLHISASLTTSSILVLLQDSSPTSSRFPSTARFLNHHQLQQYLLPSQWVSSSLLLLLSSLLPSTPSLLLRSHLRLCHHHLQPLVHYPYDLTKHLSELIDSIEAIPILHACLPHIRSACELFSAVHAHEVSF